MSEPHKLQKYQSDIENILKLTFGENANKKLIECQLSPGSTLGDNFACNVVAIKAKFEHQNEKSTNTETFSLIIKLLPEHLARKNLLFTFEMFSKEREIYQKFLPKLLRVAITAQVELPFPFFYGGHYDKRGSMSQVDVIEGGGLLNYILLEDIRGSWEVISGDRLNLLDLPRCELVLKEMAKIHAISLLYKKVKGLSRLSDEFDCLEESVITQENEQVYKNLIGPSIDNCLQIIKQKLGDEIAQKVEKFLGRAHWIKAHYINGNGHRMNLKEMLEQKPILNSRPRDFTTRQKNCNDGFKNCGNSDLNWSVFTHGDVWNSNFIFLKGPNETNGPRPKPSGVKLIDLQLVREMDLMADLSYFFYVNTSPGFRAKHLSQLLLLYYENFLQVWSKLNSKSTVDNRDGSTIPLPFNGTFTFENLKKKFDQFRLWGFTICLFVFPIILSEGDNLDMDNDLKEDANVAEVFGNINKDSNSLNDESGRKVLTERLLEMILETIQLEII